MDGDFQPALSTIAKRVAGQERGGALERRRAIIEGSLLYSIKLVNK
jgi:hypothetical protein